MLFSECLDLLIDIRSKGIVGALRKFTSISKWGDWASVLAGAAIITMFGFLFKMVGHVNDAGVALGSYIEKGDYYQYEANMMGYVWELETTVHYYHKFRLVMASYPGVIIFRLFRTFAAQ